ncbi:MAG TPA: VWA domain-containing protein [Gaiellaceae bacterium]
MTERPHAVVRHVVVFGRVLREGGLEVGPQRISDALRALDSVDLARQEDVYWALRQTLVSRRDDLETFDGAFAAWFLRVAGRAPAQAEPPRRPGERRKGGTPGLGPELDGGELEVGAWSADELLRTRDFAAMSSEEFARAGTLIRRIALSRPLRRTHRLRRDRRRGALDVRALVRTSLATGGDPVHRTYRSRSSAPRKVVLLLDISGSMEAYARALLLYLHAAQGSGRGVETFAFGTRLTRLTAELGLRDPDTALAAAAKRVVDWSGGTRIGDSLKAYNDVWGRRALTRGAVVVILSDGCERGDPAGVAVEMARLARQAFAVVWVNPLKGHPDYQPLAGGMQAASAYVDRLLSGHDIASLEALGKVLGGIERRHAA